MKFTRTFYFTVACFTFGACKKSDDSATDGSDQQEENTADNDAKKTESKPELPKVTSEAVSKDVATLFEGVTAIIKNGTDAESAKAAVTTLDTYSIKFKTLIEKEQTIEMSPEKKQSFSNTMAKASEKMARETTRHILNLKEDHPEAAQTLQKGFNKFINNLNTLSN